MTDLDLEGAIPNGICMGEQELELLVSKVIVKTRRIRANPVAPAPKKAVQRYLRLLRRQVP